MQTWQGMSFTYICKLDKKFRLVLPLLARKRVRIGDRVALRVEGSRILITRTKDIEDALPISKNCKEVKKR